MKIFIRKNKILLYFLFLIALISCDKENRNKREIFKCGADIINKKPIPTKNISPLENKNLNKKRELDSDGFKDFNIFLDLENFNYEVGVYSLEDKKDLFIQGMQKAVNTLKSLLRVKPVGNYKFTNEQLSAINISYWNQTFIGNQASKGMEELGIDLFIFVRFGDKNEMGENTLASAYCAYTTRETRQPLIGVANINREVDYSKINSLEYFQSIILHEFIHILGFSNYFFNEVFHNIETRTDENNVVRYYIISQKVLEIAKKYFSCNTITGIQLEESGGAGTVGSHWEERILLGDIMNGVVYPEEQVISEFTLALLEDSNYYKANYYTGGLMKFGKHKGCEFLDSKCIINGVVNSKFKNEFFDNIDYEDSPYDPGCTSGRQSRAYHVFYQYDSIPEQYQYFENKLYGGRSSADYCPVSQESSNDDEYYIGHCSQKGSEEYGDKIIFYDSHNYPYTYKNGDISNETGENYSDNSFCVLSSLISNDAENIELKSKIRAICYKMHCSTRSLTIEINNNFIVCPRGGGKVNVLNFNGYLLCPDYYLICSGTILCNNLFDCVEKKSLLKDDIDYDYEINTSQDISEVDNLNFSEGYELTDEGFCPKDCSQCNELHQCNKCKSGLEIVELLENEKTIRICKSETELSTGYYKNNNIYYQCIDKCNKCQNNNDCTECQSDYTFQNQKCIVEIENCINYNEEDSCSTCSESYTEINGECFPIIPNCQSYEDDGKCKECVDLYLLKNELCVQKIENCEDYENDGSCEICKSGYAFEENDRENCKNIENDLKDYYTKDGGKSYWKCDGEGQDKIENCKECHYDNEGNNLICIKCKEEYILRDDETNICYLKGDYMNPKYYFLDEFHVEKCSNEINKCDECEMLNGNLICKKCISNYNIHEIDNKCYRIIDKCATVKDEETCQQCESDYAFEGDDRTICKLKSEFNDDYYTKDDEISFYKCEGDDEENNIKNCEKCKYENGELICLECKFQFAVLDDIKNKCHNISDFNNNKYYFEDEKHIKTCSNEIDYCEKCEKIDGIINCLECQDGYAFKENDITRCEDVNIFDDSYFTLNNKAYFKCNNVDNGGIEYCLKCENEESYKKCIQCENEYILVDDENTSDLRCDVKNNYNNNKYYNINEYMIKSCSSTINNCDECRINELGIVFCTKCINDNTYFLVNDNQGGSNSCLQIDITNNEYYLYNNEYYKCNVYNSVQNCLKCQSKSSCDKCEEGYTFINESKLECKNKEELGNKYFQDDIDDTIYRKCSEYIENCNTCSIKSECSSCIENYNANKDKSLCINMDEKKYYYSEIDDDFHLCQTGVRKCEKCLSKNICIKCMDGFIKLNNNKSFCYDINDVDIDKFYPDPNDNNNYLNCSNLVQNCEICEYPYGCNLCQNGFIILNDNHNICYNKSKTDLKYYYTHDNIKYYSCKDYRFKNDIACFSINPKQKIVLKFVQAQIVNKKLVCYMITHSPLPKEFSLKIKIKINNIPESRRNLEDNSQEMDIVLTTIDDSYGIDNTIISFSSDEEFNNLEKEIIVKEIDFNEDDSLTKIVIDNNECSLEYDKASELLNTYSVNQKIIGRQIPDLSSFQQDNIVNLNFDKTNDCELILNSETPVSFSEKSLDIDLVSSDNNENQITARCNTKYSNIKSIKCRITDDVNNYYYFKSNLAFDSEKIIMFNSDKDKFRIVCDKSSSSNTNNKTIIIVVYVICSIVLVGIIFTIIIIYKKKNSRIKTSSISIPSKSLSNKRNIMTTDTRLNTQIIQGNGGTGDSLNLNIKKKNKRRKSKSSRRSSREKDKKNNNKNDD